METAKQNTGRESIKQGFVNESVRRFQYEPRGDWFSFAVNKTWFLQDSIFSELTLQRLASSAGTPLSCAVTNPTYKMLVEEGV